MAQDKIIEANQQPTPPLAAGPPADQAQVTDPGVTYLSWQASEFIDHPKGAGWYLSLIVSVAGLIGLVILIKQWLSIAVFVAMAAALLVYSNKKPRVLNYSLTDGGIFIEDKFYPYSSFKSFSVVRDVGWHAIDLEPSKRFMPRMTLMFEDKQLESIVEVLGARLPVDNRQPDWIDQLARRLRF